MLITLFFILFITVNAEQCRLVRPNGFIRSATPTESARSSILPTSSSAVSTTAASTSSAPIPTRTPFDYGVTPIRGVNLGGWFVLEPWITPSLFERDPSIIDEYTFGQFNQDKDAAMAMLEEHWNTWIVEDDFKLIAAAGLNHVRIPIGYWSVPLTPADTNVTTDVSPYLPGAWPHFLRALNYARIHGLHVIVDLHGARGSQNGYDNSGQRTATPLWATNPDNVQNTLEVIRFIAANVGGMIDVIQLLNEAAGWVGGDWPQVIRQYWLDGYNVVREAGGNEIKVMIGDAFLTVNSWDGFLKYPEAEGVMMDYHQYQIFSQLELGRSQDEHIAYVCDHHLPMLTDYASNNIWTVIGEWSVAITDCARWLNGRSIGARWDDTHNYTLGMGYFGSCQGMSGNYSTFSEDYKTYLRKYWEVQVLVGERIQGWIFWTWKTESADEWSYKKGLEGGWIPQDPSERLYPDLCQ